VQWHFLVPLHGATTGTPNLPNIAVQSQQVLAARALMQTIHILCD
jgi:hypothetical protein